LTFEEFTLQDVCSLITDGAHKSPKSVEVGLPMASVKDLTPHGINIDTCRLIAEKDFKRLVSMNCQPVKGDVLIAKDGASALDTVCEFRQDIELVLLSSVAILRPNIDIITSSYLRYYLDSPVTRQYIKGGFITGAAIPRVVLDDFKKVGIQVPPLPTQRKIAAILSAYDDLIENNTRRIQILEEIAHSIYREWFVHFRFSGHERVRMMDSGTEFGEVPEGWDVKKLGDVVELAYGKGLKKDIRAGGNIPVYGSSGIVGYHNEVLVDGPGIIVGRKGNVGSVFWSDLGFHPIDTTYFVRTELSLHYVFHNLQNQHFINNDAAVPGLSRNQANLLPFVTPSDEALDQFEEINSLLFAHIRNLTKRNTKLKATRDLLLPNLVSSQVDVSELEISV